MSYTYAQLVRAACGDPGIVTRDVASGDATSTEFYLAAVPIMANSQSVTVGGVARTEVAATPGATEYTLDDETGRIVFGAAPGSGTDNIVVIYRAVRLTDAAVAEACRQFGLDSTVTAGTGPEAAVYNSAAFLCEWMAAFSADDFDFDADGQSYKKGSTSARWQALAERNQKQARRAGGLVSIPVTRLDGYTRRGEYTTRDIGATSAQNPRRQFYGEQDDLP
jgi:hypothetical protein